MGEKDDEERGYCYMLTNRDCEKTNDSIRLRLPTPLTLGAHHTRASYSYIMVFPFLILLSLLAHVALATWGYTTTSTSYIVDTGAGLVVTVSNTNGDITSMVYNGVEYNGYDGE